MMTAASAMTLSSYVPEVVAAELRLRLLSGGDNPLPTGGVLSLASRELKMVELIEKGVDTHSSERVTSSDRSPIVSFLLESSGVPLLALDLELLDFGDELEKRVAIGVVSRALLPELACVLGIDAAAYTWRLSGQAVCEDDGRALRLTFDLVQEAEPAELFDTLGSTRLAFTNKQDDGAQQAAIRIKRSGVGTVPTP